MARQSSMTVFEAEAACKANYGNRNNSSRNAITSSNREHVRNWLVASGLPSAYVRNLSLDSLRGAWCDDSNATLAAMRQYAARSQGASSLEGQSASTIIIDDQEEVEAMAIPQPPTRANGTKPNAEEASKKLAEALGLIAGLSSQPVDENAVRKIVDDKFTAARDDITAQLKAAVDQIAQRAPVTIEVRREGDLVGRIEGRHHPKFLPMLKAASARDVSGHAPNIWISGPAGSGKTRAVHDACKALGIGFEHNGALSMPHELTGFIDAAGTYHPTPFYKAYGAACGYLFDEVDGSDNAALLALNAALANGHASFPCGSVERHKDNRIFVAANTWGMGATADYVGRAKIDAAFLDRFPVKIHFDYDEELERDICGNADWARTVQLARAKARQVGLKVAITPRASIGGAALLAAGFTTSEAAEMTYLAALTPDQRRQIGG